MAGSPNPLLFRPFHTSDLWASKRIGPHSEEVVSILVGSMLGDSWGEKRISATRFHIQVSSPNMEYLFWLHQFFANRGYCSPEKVKPIRQIGKKGKIYFFYRFRTWSFTSLNYLYNLFYQDNRKKIPEAIVDLLTPRGLAIWLINQGGVSGKGVKISIRGFDLGDIEILQRSLKKRFSLATTIHRHNHIWILYFPQSQLSLLSEIANPYMMDCMIFKLNGH